MKWHEEAVPSGCRETADRLKSFPPLGEFYLAGGTAVALYYGHRISVDLDFFSGSNSLDFSRRQELISGLNKLGIEIAEEKEGTLHARHGQTHLSLFRYSYPTLRPLRRWNSIQVAHPIDIALMKVGAIIGRGSRKDFIDLYLILQNEISIEKLLRLSKKKFKGVRDLVFQACKALVYFQDAETEPPLRMLATISWKAVKDFFETEVRKLAGGSGRASS